MNVSTVLEKIQTPTVVTGATGFVGSHIVSQLASAGTNVIAVDIEVAPSPVMALWAHGIDQIHQVQCDVRDQKAFQALMDHFDPWAVVHAAAMTNAKSQDQLTRMYDVNVQGSESVFSATKERRLVFVSSGSVYQPRSDDSSVYSEHNAPVVDACDARSSINYAATKRAGELLVKSRQSDGLDYRVARVAACFGPTERPTRGRNAMSVGRRLAELVRSGYCPNVENGAAIDLTYVGDIARGILAILVADQAHDITNVGAGRSVMLSELAQIFCNEQKKRTANDLRAATQTVSLPSGARHGVLDVRRLADLGFRPAYPLTNCVSVYLDWLGHHDY